MSTPKVLPLPRYECRRATGSIRIDGVLDEADWRRAPVVVLTDCVTGAPVPEEIRCKVRMLWDDENFYVAYDVADPDIRCTYTDRDDPIFEEDVVELFVGMRGVPEVKDHFVEFEMSPTGVMMDIYNVAPYKGNICWDAKGWQCATRVDGKPNDPTVRDRGYVVEMAIPFLNFYAQPYPLKQAKLKGKADFAPKPGEEWRLNLYHIDHSGTPEVVTYSSWSQTIERKFHKPDRFGVVTFVG